MPSAKRYRKDPEKYKKLYNEWYKDPVNKAHHSARMQQQYHINKYKKEIAALSAQLDEIRKIISDKEA